MAKTSPIEKVAALLAKAESTESEHEAQAYRETAERMMTKYRIDQALLAQTREAKSIDDLEDPIVRSFQFADRGSIMLNELYSILWHVAEHNGVMVHGFWSGDVTMVGYETDLDYTELMYNTLKLQLLQRVDPKPDWNKPYDMVVYELHEAGITWENIAHMMEIARKSAPGSSVAIGWPETPWDKGVEAHYEGYGADSEYIPERKARKDGGRLIRAYKRHCTAIGVEPHAVMQSKVFRKSFAQGFTVKISVRLMDLRQHSSNEIKSAGDGAALALRGREDMVKQAFIEWKRVSGIQAREDEAQRQADEDAANPKKRSKKSDYRVERTDFNAYSRGSTAGASADLGYRAGDITTGKGKEIQ
jgi:hypothetical protein